jgi:dTDP-glucose 4,6-dehydratase
VLAVTGSESRLRMLPLPEDDPARRRPDITRARAVLGWEPKVQLREGLSLCIPYFTQAVQEGTSAQPSVG